MDDKEYEKEEKMAITVLNIAQSQQGHVCWRFRQPDLITTRTDYFNIL